jgi:hypothetical protein
VREQARAEREQMYKTVISSRAKRRWMSQQKITSCVKFGDDIYIYIYHYSIHSLNLSLTNSKLTLFSYLIKFRIFDT